MSYAHKKIRALTDGVQKWICPDHDYCSRIFAFRQPQTILLNIFGFTEEEMLAVINLKPSYKNIHD